MPAPIGPSSKTSKTGGVDPALEADAQRRAAEQAQLDEQARLRAEKHAQIFGPQLQASGTQIRDSRATSSTAGVAAAVGTFVPTTPAAEGKGDPAVAAGAVKAEYSELKRVLGGLGDQDKTALMGMKERLFAHAIEKAQQAEAKGEEFDPKRMYEGLDPDKLFEGMTPAQRDLGAKVLEAEQRIAGHRASVPEAKFDAYEHALGRPEEDMAAELLTMMGGPARAQQTRGIYGEQDLPTHVDPAVVDRHKQMWLSDPRLTKGDVDGNPTKDDIAAAEQFGLAVAEQAARYPHNPEWVADYAREYMADCRKGLRPADAAYSAEQALEQRYSRMVQMMTNLLQMKHEALMAIIRNIRT